MLEGQLVSLGISVHFGAAPKGEVSSQDEQAWPLLSSWGQILRRAVPALVHSALSNADAWFTFILDTSLALPCPRYFYGILTTSPPPWFCCGKSYMQQLE